MPAKPGIEVGKTHFSDLVYTNDSMLFVESMTDAITSLAVKFQFISVHVRPLGFIVKNQTADASATNHINRWQSSQQPEQLYLSWRSPVLRRMATVTHVSINIVEWPHQSCLNS